MNNNSFQFSNWAVFVNGKGWILEWNRTDGLIFDNDKKYCYYTKQYASRLRNLALKEYPETDIKMEERIDES